MQTIIITGNLGKDAELRSVQGKDQICSFSVGVKQGWGDKASTNWFRCSIWGKRGATLADHLRKGVKVAITGELTVGEYQGKPQLDVRVNEVDLMSRAEGRQDRGSGSIASSGGGQSYGASDLDSDIPF